jgi:hypothetical protein
VEQRNTLLDRASNKTGLPVAALDDHYRLQRYELNEGHLRGLLDFYRRAATQNLLPLVQDLDFFPSLTPLAAAPAPPPRRSQPEQPRPVASLERSAPTQRPARPALERIPEPEAEDSAEPETAPEPQAAPESPRRSGSRRAAVRAEARAKGLRVIRGGKDTSAPTDSEDDEES